MRDGKTKVSIFTKPAHIYILRDRRSKHEVQLAKYNKNENIGTLASKYNTIPVCMVATGTPALCVATIAGLATGPDRSVTS